MHIGTGYQHWRRDSGDCHVASRPPRLKITAEGGAGGRCFNRAVAEYLELAGAVSVKANAPDTEPGWLYTGPIQLPRPRSSPTTHRRGLGYGLPLTFEQNLGQTSDQVDFLARGGGYAFLTPAEAVFALRQPGATLGGVLRLSLVNANPAPAAVGENKQAGISNYFIGNDPAKWLTNIPHYKGYATRRSATAWTWSTTATARASSIRPRSRRQHRPQENRLLLQAPPQPERQGPTRSRSPRATGPESAADLPARDLRAAHRPRRYVLS